MDALPEKTKAPTVGAVGALKTDKTKKQYSARSTSTEAQHHRLIELVRHHGRDTYRLRAHGISHPAGRVRELQKRGYRFDVTRVTIADADGYLHVGVAVYRLVSEPDGQRP